MKVKKEYMDKNDKLILYGSGIRCRNIIPVLQDRVECIIDSDKKKWGTKVENIDVCSPDVLKYIKLPVCITILDPKAIEDVREMLKNQYEYDLVNEVDYLTLKISAYVSCLYNMKKNEFSNTCNRDETIYFDCYNGLDLGGIESWTKLICNELYEKGWNVKIITDMHKYRDEEQIEQMVEHISVDHIQKDEVADIQKIVSFLKKKLPFTFVSSQANIMLQAVCILKVFFPQNIKIISVIHAGLDRFYNAYCSLDKYIDKFVAVSEDIQREMIKRGVAENKVLHMTCPIDYMRQFEHDYTCEESAAVSVGYAARLEKNQKRVDLLLNMIAEMERLNVDYHLEIAGEGKDENEIRQFIAENKLGSRIEMLGRVPQEKMKDFWKRQDICVNISDFEGRSISVMEAMANGAVPVVTATSGVREDIQSGENGYIVPLGDYEMMARIIADLDKHRCKLPVMGRKAYDVIASKCKIEDHVKLWCELLGEYE